MSSGKLMKGNHGNQMITHRGHEDWELGIKIMKEDGYSDLGKKHWMAWG